MRVALLVVVLLALCASPARADVRVYDTSAGTVSAPVTGDLLGWSDDGAALLLRHAGRVVRSDGAPLPDLGQAQAVGPGARWVGIDPDGVTVHGPDGRVLARATADPFAVDVQAAWMGDRAAILGARGRAPRGGHNLSAGREAREAPPMAEVGAARLPDVQRPR